MPTSLKVYATPPSAEAMARARTALDNERPGAKLETAVESGTTVVTATWSEALDDATSERLRGVLVEQLTAPPTLIAPEVLAVLLGNVDRLERVLAGQADITARLIKAQAYLDAIAARQQITVKV